MRVAEETLQLANSLDDKRMAVAALIYLEQSAAALGRLEESVARGRDLARRIRDDRFLRSGIENIVLSNLSMSLILLGQTDEALELARRAYPLVEQAGRVLDLLDPMHCSHSIADVSTTPLEFSGAPRCALRREATGGTRRAEPDRLISGY
jgi:hypothetical protein